MTHRTPQDVRAALEEHGLIVEMQNFGSSTATAQQAAKAIGAELGSIVKSLCFLVDGHPIVVLAAGDRQVDSRKLGAFYGLSRKKVKMADPEVTLKATGYTPGSVPPIGHVQELPILLDDTLARYEIVYAAAGSPQSIFPITYHKLVEITGGTVLHLTRE